MHTVGFMNHVEFLQLVEKAKQQKTGEGFWDTAISAFSQLGVTGIGYGYLALLTEQKVHENTQAVQFRHSYPKAWEDISGKSQMLDQDLSVESLISGVEHFRWHDDPYEDQATVDQIRQADLEHDLGMQFGISFPLTGYPSKTGLSGIGMWVEGVSSNEEFEAYWADKMGDLKSIGTLLDVRIRQDFPEILVPLTLREKDCLTYLAVGLTPDNVAARLGISRRTYDNHISSARRKFGGGTRDHIVIKSLMMNLISP